MNNAVAMSKPDDLRRAMRRLRSALPPEEHERLSLAVQDHVLQSDAWQRAKSVLLYTAVRGEVGTARLLQRALAEGKELYLPRCRKNEPGLMDSIRCRSLSDLTPGTFCIPEPQGSSEDIVPDFILVPGTAFRPDGFRLGMGGGYYDRFLALPGMNSALTVGAAFSFQITENFMPEAWDKPVRALCTEKGWTWTR